MISLSPKKEEPLQLTELPYNMDLIEEGRQDGRYYSDSSSSYSSDSESSSSNSRRVVSGIVGIVGRPSSNYSSDNESSPSNSSRMISGIVGRPSSNYSSDSESGPSNSSRVISGIVGRPFSLIMSPIVTNTPVDGARRSHSQADGTPRSVADGIPRSFASSPRSTIGSSRFLRSASIAALRSINMAGRPLANLPIGSPNRPNSSISRPYSSAYSVFSLDSRRQSTNARRRRRPQSMQLQHPISRNYPVFTIAITIAIWISFLLGVGLSKDLSWQSIGWHSPISPPNNQWWFFTVAPFPSCTDERFKAWRVLSMQLVHAGLWHIGGNSVAIMVFGSILEIYHPLSFVSTIFVFETSVAAGVLGYSALSPYDGIVGASPGAYGLIGACWYVAIFHRDLIDPVVAFVLPIVLIAHLGMDLMFFYISYDSGTAYSSHVVGMVVGFFFAMSLTMTYRKISWNAIGISLLGIVIFSTMIGLLLWHYLLFFPPEPFVSPLFHNMYTKERCCHQLFQLMEKNPTVPKETLVDWIVCDD